MSDTARDHWQPILERAGQTQLLEGWDHLDEAGRSRLAAHFAAWDWSQIAALSRLATQPPLVDESSTDRIRRAAPPRHLVRLPELRDPRVVAAARETGCELLAAGRVSAIVVAGGQGTRLGFDQPKGLYPIGPVTGRTLFAVFADQLRALRVRFGRPVPWLVMTSSATHAETVRSFAACDHYGLGADNVRFFQQGALPAFDRVTGRVLMTAPDEPSLSPDGHGGLVTALDRAGLLDELAARDIETCYYHQVDNPLAILCDPVFLGLHASRRADVSTKVVAKTGPGEKVGVVSDLDGRTEIVEYSDLPRESAEARDAEGRLRFWAGNTAIHVFQRKLLQRLATAGDELPFHRAVKKVPYWTPSTGQVTPDAENAVKFERFIFDALPKAELPLVVEVERSEEFAPLKNATGEFSPEHVRESLSARARSWLVEANQPPPGPGPVEIDPLAGWDRTDFRERAAQARSVPRAKGWWVTSLES